MGPFCLCLHRACLVFLSLHRTVSTYRCRIFPFPYNLSFLLFQVVSIIPWSPKLLLLPTTIISCFFPLICGFQVPVLLSLLLSASIAAELRNVALLLLWIHLGLVNLSHLWSKMFEFPDVFLMNSKKVLEEPSSINFKQCFLLYYASCVFLKHFKLFWCFSEKKSVHFGLFFCYFFLLPDFILTCYLTCPFTSQSDF